MGARSIVAVSRRPFMVMSFGLDDAEAARPAEQGPWFRAARSVVRADHVVGTRNGVPGVLTKKTRAFTSASDWLEPIMAVSAGST